MERKPLNQVKKKTELVEKKVSRTDSGSGVLRKNEKETCFAYSFHTACDERGIILAIDATAANVHDSVMFEDVLNLVEKNTQRPEYVAVDAGYKTPYICKTMIDRGIEPALPYKRPMTKDGFFKKYEFAYDEHYDCYVCPNNQVLNYSTTNRDGYKEYKSDKTQCKTCPNLKKCTNSKNHTKVIVRHVWENYLEMAEHKRHEPLNKSIYSRRKETIERVFADMKEKHGMRWTTLRGLQKVKAQATLVAACMNLRKMANWTWKMKSTVA